MKKKTKQKRKKRSGTRPQLPPPPPVFSNEEEPPLSSNDNTIPAATSVVKTMNHRTPSSTVASSNNGKNRSSSSSSSSSSSAVVSEAAQGDTDAAVAVALLAYLAFDSAASPSAAAFCTAKTILPNTNDQNNKTAPSSARNKKRKKKTSSNVLSGGEGVDDGGGSRSDRVTGSITSGNIGEAPKTAKSASSSLAASHLVPSISMEEAEVTDTVSHKTADLHASLSDEDDGGQHDDYDLDDDDHTVLAPLSPTSIRAAMSDVDTVTSFFDQPGGGSGGLGESALGGKENGGAASRGSLSLFLLSNSKTSSSSSSSSTSKRKQQTVSKSNRKNVRSGNSSLFASSVRTSFSAHSISEEGEEEVVEDDDDDCSLCAVVGHPASTSGDNNLDYRDPSCNDDDDEEGSSQAADEVLLTEGHAAAREAVIKEEQTSRATKSIKAQPPTVPRTSLSMLLEQQHYSPRTRVRKSTMNLDHIHDADSEDYEDETEEELENDREQIFSNPEKDQAWNYDDDAGSHAESCASRQNVASLQAKTTAAAIVTAEESKAKSDDQDEIKPAEGETAPVCGSTGKSQKDDSARLEEMTSGGPSIMSQSRDVSEAIVSAESFSEPNVGQKLQPSQCSNMASAVSEVASMNEARESILPALAQDNKVITLENETPQTLESTSTDMDTSLPPPMSLGGPGPMILATDAPLITQADEVEAGGISASFAAGPVVVASRAAAFCLSEDGMIDNVRSTLSPTPPSEPSAAKSMTVDLDRVADPPTFPMREVADAAISSNGTISTDSASASAHERLQVSFTTASHKESRLESPTTNLHSEALCEEAVSVGVNKSTVTDKTPFSGDIVTDKTLISGDIHDSSSAERATEMLGPSTTIEQTLTKCGMPASSSQREEKKDEGHSAAESFLCLSDLIGDSTAERSEREVQHSEGSRAFSRQGASHTVNSSLDVQEITEFDLEDHSDGAQFSALEGRGPSVPEESPGESRDTAVKNATNGASLNGKVEQLGVSAAPMQVSQEGENGLCAQASNSSSALTKTKLDTSGAPASASQLSDEKDGRSEENSPSALKDGQEAVKLGDRSDVAPDSNQLLDSASKNNVGTPDSDSANSEVGATLTPVEPPPTAKSTDAPVPSPSATPPATAPATPAGQPANSAGAASANRFAVVSLSFLAPNLSPKKACDCIEEAVRILKPGGRLYVVDWDGRTVSKLPDWARNWLKPVADGDDANLQKQYEQETQQILNRMGRRNYEETTQITRWIGSLSY